MGIKVPSATNNTKIGNDGHLEFEGTGTNFDDMIGDTTAIQVSGVGVSKDPVENSIDYTTTATLSDYAYTNYQFSHSRKNGANVFPHIHFWQNNNATPNFLLRYRWQVNGQAKVTAWSDYKCTTLAFTYVSGSLVQIAYGAPLTPPAGDDVSVMLQIRMFRDNANTSGVFAGADTYAGDAEVISLDVHYEKDSVGSNTEYGK